MTNSFASRCIITSRNSHVCLRRQLQGYLGQEGWKHKRVLHVSVFSVYGDGADNYKWDLTQQLKHTELGDFMFCNFYLNKRARDRY